VPVYYEHIGDAVFAMRFLDDNAMVRIISLRLHQRLHQPRPFYCPGIFFFFRQDIGCAPIRLGVLTVWLPLIAILILAPAVHAQPGGSQPPHFAALPTSGPAPLTVTFCASAGIGIDFGDGTSSGMNIAQNGKNGNCPTGGSSYATHIYTVPGTYQLRGFPCPSPNDTICGEVAQQASAVKIAVTPGA
jgi:hypothetical protein